MNKKILIVEDDTNTREMMSFWLKTIGYCAITAENGQEAVDRVIENRPDLILMDFMMPVMDGLSATRKIRDLEGEQIPILMITAFDVTVKFQAFEAGCNVLVPKPVEFDKLASIMNQFLT
jgi:CheY-like chemotaxis protein